jgi:hypothetical protein
MFGLSLVRVGWLRLFVRCGLVLIVGLLCRRLRGRGLLSCVLGLVLVFRGASYIGKQFVRRFAL